jgi:hypothetical protein
MQNCITVIFFNKVIKPTHTISNYMEQSPPFIEPEVYYNLHNS